MLPPLRYQATNFRFSLFCRLLSAIGNERNVIWGQCFSYICTNFEFIQTIVFHNLSLILTYDYKRTSQQGRIPG